jgi:DtxR family Mn-dependent transcriptional regulator
MTIEWISAIILTVFLLLAFFIPRRGLLARFKTWQALRLREQVEDALKHLHDWERQTRHASPESLAGVLGLSVGKATALISKIQSQGLIEYRGLDLHLTADGERWALHILRAHRLWERYLADEARMPLQQVHGEAHRREHTLSDTELDQLDAALGHPSRDPHGDPIPNRQGQMPVVECAPLTNWPLNRLGRIIHLEDEPAIAYQQILAAGLHLGQTIRILETSSERYILADGENEYRLAPAVAANVNVEPILEPEATHDGAIPLHALPYDQKAEIIRLDDEVQGFTRRRFLDLGLLPGTVIYPELNNFFGDPRAYRIRGTLIALRKDQAAQIWVRPT